MRIESFVELSQSRIRIELYDFTDEDLRFAVEELADRTSEYLRGKTVRIRECDTSLTFTADAASRVFQSPNNITAWFLTLGTWMGLSILSGGEEARHWLEGMEPETPVPYPEPQVRFIRDEAARRVTVLLRIDVTAWPKGR